MKSQSRWLLLSLVAAPGNGRSTSVWTGSDGRHRGRPSTSEFNCGFRLKRKLVPYAPLALFCGQEGYGLIETALGSSSGRRFSDCNSETQQQIATCDLVRLLHAFCNRPDE